MGFSGATPALGCSSGPSVGAVALESAVIERWAARGVHSLGIFNCRRIAGTSSWSLHAEGRAVDLGVPSADMAAGYEVLAALQGAGDGLLQRIMWDRRIYDAQTPQGRAITAGHLHTDHLHVELSWPGARGEVSIALPDDTDNEDEMTPDQVRVIVESELNKGTANGQASWAGTSKAVLGTVQGLVNSVAQLQRSLDELVARAE